MFPIRRLQCLVARLAFVAVALLACAPTLNRCIGSGLLAGLTELCTGSGLRYVALADLGAGSGKATPAQHHGGGEDCAYCALLGTTALLAVALLLPPSPPRDADPPQPAALPWRARRLFSGHRPRGPPQPL